MGKVKGQLQCRKWRKNKSAKLTRKEAILANCYICNGEEESAIDCKGEKSCPLYQYHPHRSM